MRIIHFSDLHTGGGAEDFRAYLDKRWVGVFNHRFRRRFQHNFDLLPPFFDYVLIRKPDLLICTGDLTSTGQPGEFAEIRTHLQRLLDAQIPLFYTPGNHDCYVKRGKCVRAMRDTFSVLNKSFGLDFDLLPVLRTVKEADFFLVNESFPTHLLSSCGYLKPDARDFILKCCALKKERPRILIGHYPVIEHAPLLRFRHRLYGQRPLLPLLKNGTLDLSLHGHIHAPYFRTWRGRVLEVCSGSLTRNGTFAEIEVSADGIQSVSHRKIMSDFSIQPCPVPEMRIAKLAGESA